jgi:hypothetical protein
MMRQVFGSAGQNDFRFVEVEDRHQNGRGTTRTATLPVGVIPVDAQTVYAGLERRHGIEQKFAPRIHGID